MCVFLRGIKLYGQQHEGWILEYSRNFTVLVLGALMCDMQIRGLLAAAIP